MSKRRRIIDKYYQEWHIKRLQEVTDVDEEWQIDVPRPIATPPAGTYWAVELRSLVFKIDPVIKPELITTSEWALTTSSRIGKLPFMTACGDPENIWWFNRELTQWPANGALTAASDTQQGRHTNHCVYTDHKGQGKLIIPDHIYLQVSTTNHTPTLEQISLTLEYSFTTVSCAEYVQELVGQLNEA